MCFNGGMEETRAYDPYNDPDYVAYVDEVDYTAYLDELEQMEANGSCSICDALGHGYPGGGPCPLEVNERYRDEVYEDERRAGAW